MNRPTPDQIQRFIAKLLGWTDICEPCAKSGDFHGVPPNKADQEKGVYRRIIRKTMPNWPRDRNASKDLLIKDKDLLIKDMEKFRYFMEAVAIWGPIPEGGRDPRLSAEKECLAWLLYNGYRWNGEQFVKEAPND